MGTSRHRGKLGSALTTYSSLPAHYAPHMWSSLESFMLSRALDTHADLDKTKDVEWIHILLAFLKTYVDCQGMELLLHETDKIEYISQLVEALRVAAAGLPSGPDLIHPIVHVHIAHFSIYRFSTPRPPSRFNTGLR